jgi:tetraacyldisaccharide 4'-kinase
MMRAPEFWRRRGALAAFLLPASALYYLGARWKRARTATQRAGVPVICVGNAVLGGAGKTPVALAIGERLKAQGVRAFYLSRGYGSTQAGPLLVDAAVHSAAGVGDEPLLLARVLPTVVSCDRAAGARFAVEAGAQALVMDDGLQNASLHKDISLLVVDGEYRFGNGMIFPAGPLREPVEEALARVDAAVVIGGAWEECAKPVLRAALVAQEKTLAGIKVVGFAGIGQPDHHPYTQADLSSLRRRANGARLVTTAKDAVRLPNGCGDVAVVEVTLAFEDMQALDALLAKGLQV